MSYNSLSCVTWWAYSRSLIFFIVCNFWSSHISLEVCWVIYIYGRSLMSYDFWTTSKSFIKEMMLFSMEKTASIASSGNLPNFFGRSSFGTGCSFTTYIFAVFTTYCWRVSQSLSKMGIFVQKKFHNWSMQPASFICNSGRKHTTETRRINDPNKSPPIIIEKTWKQRRLKK